MPAARTKRRLPTDLQSFPKLRERGCYYADKTVHNSAAMGAGRSGLRNRVRALHPEC